MIFALERSETYYYEHHTCDKNNATGHLNVGPFAQQVWCHCKLKKSVDEQQCTNVQSFVRKPIFVSKRNSIEEEMSKIFDCTR